MTNLTWNEFKKMIDQQLKEKNIDPNTNIWYIDISYPQKEHASGYKVPFVSFDEHSGLAIGE